MKKHKLVGRLRILRRWKKEYSDSIGSKTHYFVPEDELQVKVGLDKKGQGIWISVPIVEEKDA